MRTGAAVLAIASVIVLGACGGGGSTPSAPSAPPTPIPATRAEVRVSITPTSPVAQPTGDGTYPWRVDWTLVLRETAGLGGNVNYVDVGFVNSFGFETLGALNYGADEIIRRAGRNHLDARGELQIPLAPLNFTDDRGNRMMLG